MPDSFPENLISLMFEILFEWNPKQRMSWLRGLTLLNGFSGTILLEIIKNANFHLFCRLFRALIWRPLRRSIYHHVPWWILSLPLLKN